MRVVYFSSASENTHRFVTKLGVDADRIPLHRSDQAPTVTQAYVLVVPTYGGGGTARGAVPHQVIRFLNDATNRALLRGVVAAGNTNFGADYCRAGDIVAAKCGVPLLHRFELLGTRDDVALVRERLTTS